MSIYIEDPRIWGLLPAEPAPVARKAADRGAEDVDVITVTPTLSPAGQDAAFDKGLFATDPDTCCALRRSRR